MQRPFGAGVAAGDLNEDGKLDIIATNWGLNNKYRWHADQPLRLYYGDFDNNGTLDLIEAYTDTITQKIVPLRGFEAMRNAIPFIAGRTRTYAD